MTPRLTTPRARNPSGAARRCAAEILEPRTLLAAAVPAGFQDTPYASGMSLPTAMEFAPDGRLFVTQQGGQLRVILPGSNAPLATPFLTVPTSAIGERWLLSVAFDPNFPANGYLYVYYTAATPATHNRIIRFTAVDDASDPNVYHTANIALA